jgi:hypothetical protein
MEDNIKTYKSANEGISKGKGETSNLGFSSSGNGGAFIHSYVKGPNSGYTEPGTWNRPVFGVNSDNYFSGKHVYPRPNQQPMNSIYGISDISNLDKSNVHGFGWAPNTLYPIIQLPSKK